MSDTSTGFLDASRLTPVDPEVYDRAFLATTGPVPWPKAYGGDLVTQAAAAATATVGDDLAMHSVHSYFMRPVDVHSEVRYEVECLRDGRSFSTRAVRAFQNGKPVFTALASFQIHEEGPEFSAPVPDVVLGDPEALPSAAEVLSGRSGAAEEYWSHGRSFDMRHVPGPLYISPDPERAPAAHQAVWLRAFSPVPTDHATQRLALAYACDYTILESFLRVHGTHWQAPGLVTASLDHSMWFHRDGDVNDWVLYAQEAVSGQNNRGLATGRFFDRDGRLLATVAQEGMIRQ